MKVPKLIIPFLVLITLVGGYYLRFAFTLPTTSVDFQNSGEAKLTCIVQGLKCKGTASFFTRLYNNAPGISSIETYASEHKAVFTYNPFEITPDEIRAIMEQLMLLQDGSSRQVFWCKSMEIME